MLHEFFFKKPSGADMQQRKSSEAYLCQILLVKYKPQWHRYACTQNPGCISAPVKGLSGFAGSSLGFANWPCKAQIRLHTKRCCISPAKERDKLRQLANCAIKLHSLVSESIDVPCLQSIVSHQDGSNVRQHQSFAALPEHG